MHTLPAARPLPGRAAALACAAAMALGLAAAGSAGPPPTAGSPAPAPAISRLTAIASRVAKATGGLAPARAAAVLTTHAKALIPAAPGDIVPGAGAVLVFLVTMRGHFAANAAPRPPGAAAPAGRYLPVVVDATTFQMPDFGLSPQQPPVSPASLGPVSGYACSRHPDPRDGSPSGAIAPTPTSRPGPQISLDASSGQADREGCEVPACQTILPRKLSVQRCYPAYIALT
jgi:hypothetical protein